ncbi:conjugal transfer protein [Nocardioides sp. S5]|uniref:MobF family relaxase n=1 Tax=Nocardioides sp. S5 TaxID=2017486 RepID=UPI001A8C472B|nr:MobF family relaxase [Nocardioides sp. S5]QSR31280.1 conjugal transfer protein [Nocardioides sp. S5]
MTVSMRVMSAGRGYDYLLKSVVRGDREMGGSTALTRYYTEEGTPPGRWLGSGLHAFGNGRIRQGDGVTPQQLALLLGSGRDPVTGEPLGRAFPEYEGVRSRVAARVAKLPNDLTDEQRHEAAAMITHEEVATGTRRAVAGYDFTFSAPKSVSTLWGVADAGTQALILEAHHRALDEVVAFLEREVATTRRGVAAGDGAVAQADIVGIVATAYDHWDSRHGDPQLHTHVVISNKVKTAEDGRWRSLDGRPLHAAVVALSAHYNAVLADRMTRTFGIEWEQRDRGKNHNVAWELEPVPESLIHAFSGRSRMVDEETDRLIEEYVARHGCRPSATRIIELRAKATLATRPEKVIRSLFDLTTEWRKRAQTILGASALGWARRTTAGPFARPTLRADDIPLDVVADVGASVVGSVSEGRSTWRHWNLWAEASRQTMGWRFASVEDREAVIGMVVDAAKRESVSLTPLELAISPEVFQRKDGSTVFRPRHSVVFTAEGLLAAEDRLLARTTNLTAPSVSLDLLERVALRQHGLSAEQVETLARIAVSGRQVDLLVGPAGAGKTTAMHALKTAWTIQHGKGSVVGLAPSAVAAQVLAEDLGIGCENTAKWLHEHDRGRAKFETGQLVIVDEATLAGTLALDRLAALASEAGAKVLLVGDWAQLQSVEAGGAFTLLASARPDTPELTEVHRFTNEWEKAASLDLRFGRVEVVGTYAQRDRVREGTTDDMVDAAYLAWRDDVQAGRAAILIADATETVRYLNTRARADRIAGGDPAGSIEVNLADSTRTSIGDLVITRRNDRRLPTTRGGWVRNGDRWRVTGVGKDGSVTVQRLDVKGESVTLPAAYVAVHVELGYAVTAHRAQGITVDTSHVVVSRATTRENLYVSMTRGREVNIAYVALDKPDEIHAPPEPDEVNGRTVLYGVLKHSGADLSAHQMIVEEQERWSSIAQLAAEYETIAAVAQRDRWVGLVGNCGLTDDQVDLVLGSDSFGPLTAELRRAEANGHDVGRVLPALVAQRSLEDAQDVGAVLISRLRKKALPERGRRAAHHGHIAGLIPAARGPMSPEMMTALAERHRLMESRAAVLALNAVGADASWLKRLGTPPVSDADRRRWLNEVRTVAAYRDRYQVDGPSALGEVRHTVQNFDVARAQQAIRRARAIADDADRTQNGGDLSIDRQRRALV